MTSQLDRPVVQRLIGLCMVIAFAGVITLVVAAFNGSFNSVTTVTVRADRAGLMMAAKDRVKYHGVQVGTVREVSLVDDGVELVLDLDPEQAAVIDSSVTARISPETLFGNKFIDLVARPDKPSGSTLSDGAVLVAGDVGTEVNTLFENLMKVLDTAKPSQVHQTLQALSSTLRGKGDQLGELLVKADTYLDDFADMLPDLRRDFDEAAKVADLYADVAPEGFRALDNVTEIGNTVVAKQKQLRAFLKQLNSLGFTGTDLFRRNGQDLLDTLRLLEPTSDLLREYSPMLRCFIEGTDNARKLLEPPLGGKAQAGILTLNLLPGKEPYRYPDDLPEVKAASGPNCYGLPDLADSPIPAPQIFIPGMGYDPPQGKGSDSIQIGRPPIEVFGAGRGGGR